MCHGVLQTHVLVLPPGLVFTPQGRAGTYRPVVLTKLITVSVEVKCPFLHSLVNTKKQAEQIDWDLHYMVQSWITRAPHFTILQPFKTPKRQL